MDKVEKQNKWVIASRFIHDHQRSPHLYAQLLAQGIKISESDFNCLLSLHRAQTRSENNTKTSQHE